MFVIQSLFVNLLTT